MHNHDIDGISTQQPCTAILHCTHITVVTARYVLLQAFKNELHCILSWRRVYHTGIAIRIEHALKRVGWIDSNERITLSDKQYQLFMDNNHGQYWRNDGRRHGVNLHGSHGNRNSTGSTISRAQQNTQLVPGMNRSTTAIGDRVCPFISSHCLSYSFNLRDIHSHLHREAKQNSRFSSSSNTASSLLLNSNRDNTWLKVETIHDRESHSIPWSIIERSSSDVAGVSPFVPVSILSFRYWVGVV